MSTYLGRGSRYRGGPTKFRGFRDAPPWITHRTPFAMPSVCFLSLFTVSCSTPQPLFSGPLKLRFLQSCRHQPDPQFVLPTMALAPKFAGQAWPKSSQAVHTLELCNPSCPPPIHFISTNLSPSPPQISITFAPYFPPSLLLPLPLCRGPSFIVSLLTKTPQFSAKMFHTLYTSVLPSLKYPVRFLFRQQIQPWVNPKLIPKKATFNPSNIWG